jgi:CubicO group peptidase (beta-lactamase class C family)
MPSVLAAAVLGFSALALPPGDTAEKPFSAIEEFDGLPERWAQAGADLGVPGFSVAFVRDGQIEAIESFGIRDARGAGEVDPDTIFYIASCTKTYVAAAILALADDGKLDLDAPVKTYLPRFALADDALASSITVRDLLSHKPGINSGPIVMLDAYTGEITDDRYYYWLSQVEPTGEMTYTNVHFTILGRVVEAVSGKPWKDYIDERIFEPAGMHRTTGYASEMYGDANAAFPLEESADGGFVRAKQIKEDSVMHAAGGLGTSANDGARWVLLNLNNGEIGGTQVISEHSMKEMHTRQSTYAEPSGSIRVREGFGLGWMHGNYRHMTEYFEHGGGYIGTAAHLSFMPERGWGVVVLANASPSGQAMCDVVSIDIYDRLLGAEDDQDLLPLYVDRINQMRERRDASDDETGAALAAEALSVDPAMYAGSFTNAHLGTVVLNWSGKSLAGHIGLMGLTVVAGDEVDHIGLITTDGDTSDGQFVIEDGEVVAIVLEVPGSEARFDRAD